MIDSHYGHLARDRREHAVALLDANAGERPPLGRSVDTAHTLWRPLGNQVLRP
jgi:hypothetical protein